NVFFFFQGEDGIRVRNVTGVQTCALPIFAFLFCKMAVTRRIMLINWPADPKIARIFPVIPSPYHNIDKTKAGKSEIKKIQKLVRIQPGLKRKVLLCKINKNVPIYMK